MWIWILLPCAYRSINTCVYITINVKINTRRGPIPGNTATHKSHVQMWNKAPECGPHPNFQMESYTKKTVVVKIIIAILYNYYYIIKLN